MGRTLLRRFGPTYGAVTALAVAWFFAAGGALAMDPTDVTWMMRGDWNMALFGWLFARNAPLGLPLGMAPDLLAPYGTSLGFTDSIPGVGALFRLLSFALPWPFQYFGLWLLACFVLPGWVGVALAERRTTDKVAQVLSGALFVFAPVLVARLSHPSLCGQWVVLAAAALFLVPARDVPQVRRHALGAVALVALAVGFHLYLAAMVSVLTGAFVLSRAWVLPRLAWKETAAWLAGLVTALLVPMAALGFFSGPPARLGAEGFGVYSADLLALFNPMGWSRVLPAIPSNGPQAEGFAWLGAGAVALVGVAVAVRFTWLRKEPAALRELAPFAAACAVLGLYALSSRVTVAAHTLVSLDGLYAPLSGLTSMFRGSGRFMWPAMWALTAFAVVTLLRLSERRRWFVRATLGAAVLLQAADLPVERSAMHRPEPAMPFRRLTAPEWQLLGHDYAHVALHPVHLQWVCRFDPAFVVPFAWLAIEQHLSFNSGHVARVPAAFPAACEAHLPPGPLDGQTLYVLSSAQHAVDFDRPEATCGRLEGFVICVSAGRDTPLRQFLAGQVDPLAPLRRAPR